MWSKSHSHIITNAHKDDVWRRLSDVNTWHEWIPDIEYCQLEKSFQAGNRFILKPKGAKAVIMQLSDVEKGQKFTACVRFFGATMHETYEMRPTSEGIHLTTTLAVTGPLGFLWRMMVVEKIATHLPIRMGNLENIIQKPVSAKITPLTKAQEQEEKPSSPLPKKPNLQLVTSEPKIEKSKPSSLVTKKVKTQTVKDKKDKSDKTSLQAKPKKPVAKKSQASVEAPKKTTKPKALETQKKKEKPKKEKPKAET